MKVGIIGSGFGLYGLLPAFNSLENCEVVSICGKKTERLLSYCKKIGIKKIYTDWKKMLKDEDLDAIAVAVIPRAQYEIAKFAMNKGIHIFAEKPLTANLKQAKELLTISKKKKIITTVDFIFPEIEEWQKAKELIDKKVYGELKHISVNWDFLSYDIKNKITSWKTDVKEGGGVLSFYMSHTLHYLEYFGGIISKVKSNFSYVKESKNGGEVEVDLILKFKNGVSGDVHVSANSVGLNNHQLTFVCDKATIILESDKGVTENFILKANTQEKVKVISVKKSKSKKNNDERVRIVIKISKRFVQSCISRLQVSPSFVEGLRVQQLIEKIRIEKI